MLLGLYTSAVIKIGPIKYVSACCNTLFVNTQSGNDNIEKYTYGNIYHVLKWEIVQLFFFNMGKRWR